MFEIKFEGIDEVSDALTRWEGEAIEALTRAIDASGEHLLATSQKLTPKLTGDLEGSGDKTPVKQDRGVEISVEVGYRHLPYARRRHEEVYNLGTITRGKPNVDGMTVGRKYLEQPVIRYFQRYISEWAAAVKRVTGG